VSRVDLHSIREGQKALSNRVEELSSPFTRLYGEVRPAHIAHEESIAREEEPGLLGARCIGDGEGDMLRAVARGMDYAQSDMTYVENVPIFELTVWVVYSCALVNADLGPGKGELTVARHMVSMVVGLNNVPDTHPFTLGQLQVGTHVPLGIDYQALARAGIAHQIGSTAQVVTDELFEEHLYSFRDNGRTVSYLSP
jgi:hypothetical protein